MTLTLLALLTIGQCQGGYCPTGPMLGPSFDIPFLNATPLGSWDGRVYSWRWTRFQDGHEDYAWGWKDPHDPNGYQHVEPVPSWASPKPNDRAAIPASRKPQPSPPPSPPAGPPGALPTGVRRDLFPTLNATGPWYGGNVPHERKVGAEPGAKPKKDFVHLTFIGDKRELNDAKRLMESTEARELQSSMGPRLYTQYMAPSNPLVKDIGLTAGGHPDVVVQRADGGVVYRSKDLPKPKVLVAEVRKADPAYNPANDPGGALGCPLPSEARGPALALLVFVVTCGFLVYKKR